MEEQPSDVTLLLNSVANGKTSRSAELLSLVYNELRRLAASRLAREKPGQTLQATALVHEAWLRLTGENAESREWNHRGHFFCAAAEAMRRILVENARRKARLRRGGKWERVELDRIDIASELPDDRLLAVHEALEELETHDPQGARLIKLRFFVGMTQSQAAEVLGVSERTAKRLFAYARAWLFEKIGSG